MNVFITGGAGYIGSHAVQRLVELRHQVIAYDNLSTGFKKSLLKEAQFVFGDIRDHELISRVFKDFKVDAVIHFAAKSVVPESMEKPLEYYENNVFGTLQLLKAMQKHGVKNLIFSSSASVYGDAKEVPISENSPLLPSNTYGETKKMGEQIIEDISLNAGIKFVNLRYFNVAGARVDGSNGQMTERATHLVKVAAEAACGVRNEVEVYGSDYPTEDGTGVRDYIHVEDLVEAHVLALKYLTEGGSSKILNCGYGHGFSVLQVLKTMQQVSGRDFKIYMKDRRPGDVAQSFAETTQIRETLQWEPMYDNLEIICRSAFEWEKKCRGIK